MHRCRIVLFKQLLLILIAVAGGSQIKKIKFRSVSETTWQIQLGILAKSPGDPGRTIGVCSVILDKMIGWHGFPHYWLEYEVVAKEPGYVDSNAKRMSALFQTHDNDSEMVAPDVYYHKNCLRCSDCDRAPDENEEIIMAPTDPDNIFCDVLQPLCKFCYAKKFKVSAMKIAEIVEIAPVDEITISLWLPIF